MLDKLAKISETSVLSTAATFDEELAAAAAAAATGAAGARPAARKSPTIDLTAIIRAERQRKEKGKGEHSLAFQLFCHALLPSM